MSNIIDLKKPKGIFSSKKHKINFKKKNIAIWGMVSVVLIIGLISGWFYISYQKSVNEVKTKEKQQQAVLDAESLANVGSISDAEKKYDEIVKQTDDVQRKAAILTSKAAMYMNEKDYDKALAAAKEAESTYSTSNIAYVIAMIYEKQGEKQKAIEYYQKAISLVDSKDPMSNSDIQEYQARIKYLSGTKE